MIITLADIRAVKLCNRGTRKFFSRFGWSWPDFLRDGRPAADFIATGDAMALKVVETAHRRRCGASQEQA